MDEALKGQQWGGWLAVEHACAPLLGLHNPRNRKCEAFNNGVVEWVKANKPDRIFLIAHWFAWSNSDGGYDLVDTASGAKGNENIFGPAFGRTIAEVRPHVKEIVVVGPTPGAVDALPYKLAMAQWNHLPAPAQVSLQAYREKSRSFRLGVEPYAAEVLLINPEPWFCSRDYCRYFDGDRLLYRDRHHLSLAGARVAATHLVQASVLGGAQQ